MRGGGGGGAQVFPFCHTGEGDAGIFVPGILTLKAHGRERERERTTVVLCRLLCSLRVSGADYFGGFNQLQVEAIQVYRGAPPTAAVPAFLRASAVRFEAVEDGRLCQVGT